MGRLVDADKFLEKVKKDREHEIYLHSWTADMVLERLDSWYAPTVDAIQKDDYEARLKADMVAMLKEIQLEIDELEPNYECNTYYAAISDCDNLLQQKINALRGEENGENNRC